MINCYRNNKIPKKAMPTENAKQFGCPACEYIYKNETYTCSKFVGLSGKDPQSENVFINEFKCADTWVPIMLVENAQTNRGQTQAIESLRNEQVKGQSTFNKLLAVSIDTGNKQLVG